MLLVSVDELVRFMSDVTLDSSQELTAETVLAGVQATLQSILGRPIVRTTVTETIELDRDGCGWLSATPVVSVTSAVDSTDATVTPTVSANGRIEAFVWAPGGITITYVAGIDGTVEESLQLAILQLASRIMMNKHDDTLTAQELSTTGPTNVLPEHFTPEELMSVDRFRRRIVA